MIRQKIKSVLRSVTGGVMYGQRSYAQESEDLIVDRLLNGKMRGYYVDVGCHHPFRFSNTYLFYKRGWHGLCLDPLPGTSQLFQRHRPRDMVAECGVSDQPGSLKYFEFDEPAVNTFDEALAVERASGGAWHLKRTQIIPVARLDQLAHQYSVPHDFDLLTVDVEGLDLRVLQSNDWSRFSPRVVIAESFGVSLDNLAEDPVCQYLHQQGYRAHAKSGHSVIYCRSDIPLA